MLTHNIRHPAKEPELRDRDFSHTAEVQIENRPVAACRLLANPDFFAGIPTELWALPRWTRNRRQCSWPCRPTPFEIMGARRTHWQFYRRVQPPLQRDPAAARRLLVATGAPVEPRPGGASRIARFFWPTSGLRSSAGCILHCARGVIRGRGDLPPPSRSPRQDRADRAIRRRSLRWGRIARFARERHVRPLQEPEEARTRTSSARSSKPISWRQYATEVERQSPARRSRSPGNRPIRRRFSPASRRSPTAISTSGQRQVIFLNFGPRARIPGACHCASTTPTRRKRRRSTSTRYRDSVKWLGFSLGGPGATRTSNTPRTTRIPVPVRGRAVRRGHAYVDSPPRRPDARAARHAHRAGQRTAPTASAASRRTQALSANCIWASSRRRTRVAREDRHGLAQHQQCATRPCIASATPRPPHRRPLVYLPTYDWAHGVSDH